jgi:omega-6 fatty acid desaturase (delta-12 desaturase)
MAQAGAARGRLPAECYRNPTRIGLAWLVRDGALYAGILTALALTDHPLALALLWPLCGLAIAGLFILGHDAAHGSLFASERLNRWLGTAAMLPALHVFEAWRFGHNRVHHGHTLRRGMDYVWEPLTPDEYARLSRAGRAWHRVCWSFAGAGPYYLWEIWWKRMLRFVPPARLAAPVRRDRALVVGFAALQLGAAFAWGLWRYGSPGGGVWAALELVIVPFLLWNYVIGFCIYVHHIAPDIAWRERRAPNAADEQLDLTTILRAPRWLNAFLHEIFVHAPHHLDVRIPFWELSRAARALAERSGAAPREKPLRMRDYLATTRTCKLFDYARRAWVDYAGRPASEPGPRELSDAAPLRQIS